MSREQVSEDQRCAEVIWRRDTYRYTGRGATGFQMHFTKRRCSRRPYKGGYCRQHARIKGIIR